jgi:nucleoside-diphosphate-sugar epimerase
MVRSSLKSFVLTFVIALSAKRRDNSLVARHDRGMRLLILGGTVFLGRALAAHAVAAGDDVTCACRGRSGSVPQGAELVRADRDEPDGLAPLAGREFDAVIDVARRPSHVRSALAALAERTTHWTFVSTGSVYADDATPGQTVDDAPLVKPAPHTVDDPDVAGMEFYGPLKVVCEQLVRDSEVPSVICRAGLIVGPEDPSDRFTYWPVRLARGADVLAPGAPEDLVQFIDVRDLAAWLVEMARTGATGVFNGVGTPMTRAEFLTSIAARLGAAAPDGPPRLVWVEQERLVAEGVRPWAGERSLPLWLPLPEYAAFMNRDVHSSIATGLATRPAADTAVDTLAWYRAAGSPPLRCGLTAEDEADLLAKV